MPRQQRIIGTFNDDEQSAKPVRRRENGADLQDIQEALGHPVITTTTTYAHISTRRRREKLAEYLK